LNKYKQGHVVLYKNIALRIMHVLVQKMTGS